VRDNHTRTAQKINRLPIILTWIVVTIPKRVTTAFENEPKELCGKNNIREVETSMGGSTHTLSIKQYSSRKMGPGLYITFDTPQLLILNSTG
jgi:hypothetical protein